MNGKIVVVGSINLDLVARVERMPKEGETLAGLGYATYAGGKGGNQAVGASRLGADVTMLGCLGDDVFGVSLRKELEVSGVSTGAVKNVSGPSGSAIILVTPDGHNSIVINPGANAALMPHDLDDATEALKGARMLLTQLEVPMDTVERLATIAGDLAIPLMLDPAPAAKMAESLLRNVTWLTPNESELRAILKHMGHPVRKTLLSEDDLTKAAKVLLDTGLRNVAIKLGGRGVYLAGADVESSLIPAHRVAVKDTTAAGDAFNAGFACALVEGKPAKEAAGFASAVAAVAVTRSGAQASMPTLHEVEVLMQSGTTTAS